MKNIILGVLLAAFVCTGLLVAQAGLEITFTISDDTLYVVKQIIAKKQNVDPASVTEAQARSGVVAFCRDAVQAEVRVWRRAQDKPALDLLFNDLTEAERAQVRALIVSLAK